MASSGRTSLLVAILAAATAREEVCALVDAEDAFDPVSAAAGGVRLDRLLWVRCGHSAEYALKAVDLLIQGGGFGVVAMDLGDTPPAMARRISLTSWFRLRRAVEHTPTVLLAVARRPNAKTCASLLLECAREGVAWGGPGYPPLSWVRLPSCLPSSTVPFTVLFVGRLYRRKRVDVLLRAAAALRGRIPNLEVRIVGHGPCAAPLRELARQLKLEGTVTWLGDVPRTTLAAEYNRAAVFCLPSVQEGFGIVLLEAMAASKPIVASRAAAIPEVAPHAALVEPDNPEALAAAIETLYRSPERRAAMAAEGARRVQQFDAPLVARRFLEAAAG
jgi:glycosyltransferase involved in cell wall biosynthesis